MAEDRFQRFRFLEKRRPGAEPNGPEAAPATGKRFEALEERAEAAPGEPAAEPVASGHLDRFRPAAERPLELAADVEGALPFIRCARCQVDSNRAATTCANCGADLWTDEQRSFNARLFAERQAQGAIEREEVAALERAREEAGVEDARARRRMGEAIAREVGDAERRRLDADGVGGWGGTGGWRGRPGWRHGLGVLGWIFVEVLRFVFRTRFRRW